MGFVESIVVSASLQVYWLLVGLGLGLSLALSGSLGDDTSSITNVEKAAQYWEML